MSKFLFISIKPEFANKIISRTKTIELRKIKPKVSLGDYVLIYATVPVKSVIGFGVVKSVIDTTPELMWENHSQQLGIDKSRFDAYYSQTQRAVGIEISAVCKIPNKIYLDDIKSFFPRFSPPQTFRYLSKFGALRTYKLISELC